MKRRLSLLLAAAVAVPLASLAAASAWAQQEVKIIDTVELSGPGAPSGTNFQKGADLATQEINAAGGILGRKIALTHIDNQSNPGTAKAVVAKAIDEDPYVILGPIFSGDVMVTMAAVDQAEIPQIMGGEAAPLTQQGYHYTFRTSLSQAAAMPKLATYLAGEAGVKTLAVVYVNNDFGKGGHDAMLPELAKRNVKVLADISTEQGQLDFSNVAVAVAKSGADALFAYLNEEESARLLIELRKQGYPKPIYGETVLISNKVIQLAGEAANGTKGHVGLSADAPNPLIKAFAAKFKKAYGFDTDHNGIKGYFAVYLVKAITEKIGKFDRKAFAAALRGAHLSTKDYPGLLIDTTFDQKGDID
ncbi:MAG TPA: ABC transporter substrate-binding protein, partial [Stellaceae bacterium]|nr:ABC transporter substrate-binding protein [Stellaceae bacterium]